MDDEKDKMEFSAELNALREVLNALNSLNKKQRIFVLKTAEFRFQKRDAMIAEGKK